MNRTDGYHPNKEFAESILLQAGQKMFGVTGVVRLCLIALYTNGHILLEGNPGLGKTELVKTLSNILTLPYGRIQFTPDLMPADITGTLGPSKENRQVLKFQPGPIFTSLLLADEINRATPKTQAAMLEAMAERQVTVVGETHLLSEHDFEPFYGEDKENLIHPNKDRPFMVMATQNPIDHEGTFDLPEAQKDRFMFKVLMPLPLGDDLSKILDKTAGPLEEELKEKARYEFSQDQSVALYLKTQQRIRDVQPIPALHTHILNLFLATNRRFDEIDTISGKEKDKLKNEIIPNIRYGLGPRALTTLMLGAKAWAFLFDVGAEKADAQALARVIVPALRHRMHLQYGWDATYEENGAAKMDPERVIDLFIRDLATLTAPTQKIRAGEGYRDIFAATMNKAITYQEY